MASMSDMPEASGIMRVPRLRHQARQSEMAAKRALGWMLFVSSLFWPRAGIIAFWIFGDQLGRAFATWVIPCIGFFVLPWTTVTYAIMWGISSDAVVGWEWIFVGLAFLLDVATWAGGRHLVRS